MAAAAAVDEEQPARRARTPPMAAMAAACPQQQQRDQQQGKRNWCPPDVPAAVSWLAERIAAEGGPHDAAPEAPARLRRCAWTILLDVDTAANAKGLPDVPDRARSNRLAAAQACLELHEALRPGDARRLQLLLEQWSQESQYQPRAASEAQHSCQQPGAPPPLPPPQQPLSEHQAALSLLLALRGSRPEANVALCALPHLGGSTVAAAEARCEAAEAAVAPAALRLSGTCAVGGPAHDSAAWSRPELHAPAAAGVPRRSPLKPAAAGCGAAGAGTGLCHLAEQLQRQQQAAARSSWLSPAAAAMHEMQGALLDLAKGTGEAAPFGAPAPPAGGSPAQTGAAALVDGLARQMQLASQPCALNRPLGLSASVAPLPAGCGAGSRGAGSSSSTARDAAHHGGRDQGRRALPPASRAAAEAKAAVESAAAAEAGVLPLMLLADQQPSSSELALLGGHLGGAQLLRPAPCTVEDPAKAQRLAAGAPQRLAVAAGAGGADSGTGACAAAAAAAEEDLVDVCCLAVQGVWSAVQHLWDAAAQDPDVRRSLVGLQRPAAQQHLLVRVLHAAELRLRLQAFVQHFAGVGRSCCAGAEGGKGPLAGAAALGGGPKKAEEEDGDGSGQAALHAFLAAVREVLEMHDAAAQVLQQGHRQRTLRRRRAAAAAPRGAGSAAASAAPATTLLQLVAQLRRMTQQLQQLAQCCWCTAAAGGGGGGVDGDLRSGSLSAGGGFGGPLAAAAACLTTTQRVLRQGRLVARRAGPADGAPCGGTDDAQAALPWPPQSSAWAPQLWDPSRWQVERRFMHGRALAEHLYAELLHAGPLEAPLLRHLFGAAVQPLVRALRTWAFQPDLRAAETAAAAAVLATFTRCSGRTNLGGWNSRGGRGSTAGCSFPGAGGGARTASAAAGPAERGVEAAASQLLLRAWQVAQASAPPCPRFLAGAQQQSVVAGLQLQLLQLLGGRGQQLAQRLGWLAELEQQELQEALHGGAPRSAAAGQPAAGGGLTLLLGARALPGSGSSGAHAAAPLLTLKLTMRQLKHAAAIVADYEAARQAELAQLVWGLSAACAAGVAAEQLRLAARRQDKAAEEGQRLELQRAAAARRRQRQRQLLLEQQQEVAAAAARRASARREQLEGERALLAQAAAADHAAAVQRLQEELSRAARVGLDVAHLQRKLHLADTPPGPAEDPVAAAAAGADSKRCVGSPCKMAGGSASEAAPAAATDVLPGREPPRHVQPGGAAPDTSQAPAPQQQDQEQQPEHLQGQVASALPGHKRATWGAPVDPCQAAGRPSGAAAGPLAVVGSATASGGVRELATAGRRSNSDPRVLPGMGSALQRHQGSRGSSGGGAHPGATPALQRRSSGGGALGGWGSSLSVSRQQQQQQQRRRGRWGTPVVPGAPAGLPSSGSNRRSSAPGSLQGGDAASAGARPPQQRQLGVGPLVSKPQQRPRQRQAMVRIHEGGNGDEASPEDVLLQVLGGEAEQPGGAAHRQWWQPQPGAPSLALAEGGNDPQQEPHWGDEQQRQQQLQQERQQQQQQQQGQQQDGQAPLITTLEVLVVRPLLAQHRLTTLACWHLLLQEQGLLHKLAGLQGLYFQQQGDWADMFLQGLEQALPAGHGGHGAGGPWRSAAAGAGQLSSVAAQLLLESAVAQSCLAGAAEPMRMSLRVDAARTLPGWGAASDVAAAAAPGGPAATDSLVLCYDVPWPASLLVGERQLRAYAQVFSVLLRLRRLQQQLTQQWGALNSRPSCGGGGGGPAPPPRRARGASAPGAGLGGRPGGRRASPQDSARQPPGDGRRDTPGLERLQRLRRWHAMALHGAGGLLGYMLSELSGKLWSDFELAVSGQPVSLPEIVRAHDRLLAAARQVCLLPRRGSEEGGGDGGGAAQLAGVAYRLADAAWALQRELQSLLAAEPEQGGGGGGGGGVEGSRARALAARLADDDGDDGAWRGLAAAGAHLEGLLGLLRRLLAASRAAAVGHPLAGLGARLGVDA